MAAAPARLLVTVPGSENLRQAVRSRLAGVPVEYATRDSSGPWPAVEAMLTGDLARDLPWWRPERTPRLAFVQQLYTGLDRFPFDRVPPHVQVAGNVGAYAPFVAEHAVALLLALAHEIVPNSEKVRAGRLRPPTPNRYLIGRTALVLGFGEVGRATSARLRALGMRVEGVSRLGAPDPEADRMHPASGLGEAIAGADVIVECRPLTRKTRGTLDAAMLGRAREEAILVNVGRAATVDEAALYEHLRSHPRFRAASDVWWQEDFEKGELGAAHPFAALPNFLGTPHVAAVGAAPRARAETQAVDNLARYFSGEGPRHIADRSEYAAGPSG